MLLPYCPTAVHAPAGTHDTLSSSAKVECAGAGVGWTDHDVPFQDSARGPEAKPTAVQALAEVHEMLPRAGLSCGGSAGVGWIDQEVPSHASPRVRLRFWPAAVQALAVVRDTPARGAG